MNEASLSQLKNILLCEICSTTIQLAIRSTERKKRSQTKTESTSAEPDSCLLYFIHMRDIIYAIKHIQLNVYYR